MVWLLLLPYTPSSMVWLLLLLETAFVCLLINFEENVQFMQFVPKCCLAIEYIQYKRCPSLKEMYRLKARPSEI